MHFRTAVALGGLAAASLGCNSLVGFSSLEKADCAGGACGGSTGTGGGGGGTGGTSSGTPSGTPIDPPQTVSAMGTGRHGTCLVTDDGVAYCWGEHTGDVNAKNSPSPRIVPGEWKTIVSGYDHRCGIDTQGQVLCWGGNDYGQLGDGTTITKHEPQIVVGLPLVDRISTAGDHTCVVTPLGNGDPQVFCWGRNDFGQVGNGNTTDQLTPFEIIGLGDVIRVAAGVGYSCAVRGDGALLCWGNNDDGQLALDPMLNPSPILQPTVSMDVPAIERIYPAIRHTCARTDGVREMICWGNNEHGQLGSGDTVTTHLPQLVAGVGDLLVGYPGARHTCAITQPLDIFCWGANDHGQLGLPVSLAPQPVAQLIAMGIDNLASKASEHTCFGPDEAISCMGLNDSGQLGDGTFESRDTPTPVVY